MVRRKFANRNAVRLRRAAGACKTNQKRTIVESGRVKAPALACVDESGAASVDEELALLFDSAELQSLRARTTTADGARTPAQGTVQTVTTRPGSDGDVGGGVLGLVAILSAAWLIKTHLQTRAELEKAKSASTAAKPCLLNDALEALAKEMKKSASMARSDVDLVGSIRNSLEVLEHRLKNQGRSR
jgi:hypothetical protein